MMSLRKLDGVHCEPGAEDSAGRRLGQWTRADGQSVGVLLEWTTSPAASSHLSRVESLPTDEDGDVDRPEEARTRKVEGVCIDGPRTAIVYRCPAQPLYLGDLIRNNPKPSGADRCRLACIVATQVRSLHVHFGLEHAALRPDSFAFFGSSGGGGGGGDGSGSAKPLPRLVTPYLLGWGQRSLARPSIYQHPEYRPGIAVWYYDVWALMIILSEIAEWRLVDSGKSYVSEKDLLEKKQLRKKTVTDRAWKGPETAQVFQWGFGYIHRDSVALMQLSRQDIRRFFDKLCQFLANLRGGH